MHWRTGLRRDELWVTLGCVVLLAVLTVQVLRGGFPTGLDRWLYSQVGAPLADARPAHLISQLGSLGLGLAVLMVATLATLHARLRLWPVLVAVLNPVLMGVVVLGLKAGVGRPGPGGLTHPPLGYFPSGHTATSAVCVGTAFLVLLTARRRPVTTGSSWAALGVGLLTGAAVGTMTIPTGNHWASDVLGGLAVAGAVMVTGFAAGRRMAVWTRR